MDYVTAFMATFRTFVTPKELVDLLIMRYQIPPPLNPTPEIIQRFKQKKEMPIQLRYNYNKSTIKIGIDLI
jgi:hypothetical protein